MLAGLSHHRLDRNMQQLIELRTFNQVTKALGGVTAVARMIRCRPSAICNWRATRGRFPAKYADSMREELARRGYSAPSSLWGQRPLRVPAVSATKIAA